VSEVQFVLAPGVDVEPLGHEVLCRVPGVDQVVRLSGGAADVVRRLSAGEPIGHAEREILNQLVSVGVVDERGGSSLSRRRLLTATGVGAMAGISLLALPAVAAASSSILEWTVLGGSSSAEDDDVVFFIYIGVNQSFPLGTRGTLTWIGAPGSPFQMEAVGEDVVSPIEGFEDVKTYFATVDEISVPKSVIFEDWALWNLRFTVNGVTYNLGQRVREDGTEATF
jgi:hypothetical protein